MSIIGGMNSFGRQVMSGLSSPFTSYQVNKRIRDLERKTGNRLTPKLRRFADEYARDMLGDQYYARFLYEYCVIHGGFAEGWLTYHYFRAGIVSKGGIGLEKVSKIKTFAKIVLNTNRLPDAGYYIHGKFYEADMREAPLASIKHSLERLGNEVVYVKPDGSVLGNDIYRIPLDELNEELFQKTGNAVIQYAVTQHPVFDEVISGPLTTIRITTGRTLQGSIRAMGAYVRFGLAGTKWIRADRSIRVAVTNADGILDSCGYMPDWTPVSVHPDTGTGFAGRSVPNFGNALDLCVELHRSVPHPFIVGWDIAVDANGNIKLLEWNADHCEIRFMEAIFGPCFAQVHWDVSDEQQATRCRYHLG